MGPSERQAVLDCINLYGDETLHAALDAIGWPQEQPGHEQGECPRCGQRVQVVSTDEGTSYYAGRQEGT